VSPVRHELGFYIPEYGILHSHRRENLKSYIPLKHQYLSAIDATTSQKTAVSSTFLRYKYGITADVSSLFHSKYTIPRINSYHVGVDSELDQ
jgi:hypothetical protein